MTRNILMANINTTTGKITYVRAPCDAIHVALNLDVTDEQLAALNAAPATEPFETWADGKLMSHRLGNITARKRTALVVKTLADHCRPMIGDKHCIGEDEWTLEETIHEFSGGI